MHPRHDDLELKFLLVLLLRSLYAQKFMNVNITK